MHRFLILGNISDQMRQTGPQAADLIDNKVVDLVESLLLPGFRGVKIFDELVHPEQSLFPPAYLEQRVFVKVVQLGDFHGDAIFGLLQSLQLLRSAAEVL